MPKLGKANSLSGERWAHWLDFMRSRAGGKYFLLLYLTNALCLRVTQVARLQTSDFHFKKSKVWIDKFKKHRGAFKPTVKQARQNMKRKGIPSDAQPYNWPKSGYMFPSRRGAKRPYMSKDTVAACVRLHRGAFLKKFKRTFPDLQDSQCRKIRSHSGRRRCVSHMASKDMSPNVIMGFAQIESYRVFKEYVDTDAETFAGFLHQADRKLKLGKLK